MDAESERSSKTPAETVNRRGIKPRLWRSNGLSQGKSRFAYCCFATPKSITAATVDVSLRCSSMLFTADPSNI